MEWRDDTTRIPVLSWCRAPEETAMRQAVDLSGHPATFHHVALMADCHPGYGMPIGGVIACTGVVIPYAVGVDIGCGMAAARSDIRTGELGKEDIRTALSEAKRLIPVGEGHSHRKDTEWMGFRRLPEWMDDRSTRLARRSLGTLGGGNHFLEIREGDDGLVWLIVHSGSRNPGYRIARHHHEVAVRLTARAGVRLPNRELSYLPVDSTEGAAYIRDMTFAMDYAEENRRRLMEKMKSALRSVAPDTAFSSEVAIHHNYACPEEHFGREVWVHRKGATSAEEGELGIIPGSMGTASYIVRGLGNPDSFSSCSHGAGRVMGRKEASRRLTVRECNEAMRGIIFDGWEGRQGYGGASKGSPGHDLSEAPGAYRDISEVMRAQTDLVEPLVELKALGVVKG